MFSKQKTAAAVTGVLLSGVVCAALDVEFGDSGVAFDLWSDRATAVPSTYLALATDNQYRIIAGGFGMGLGGERDVAIVTRYDESGIPDADFGTNGAVELDVHEEDELVYELISLPDSKILVVGTADIQDPAISDVFLAKLNEDGSLDTSFGNDGKVLITKDGTNDFVAGAVVLKDGSILLAGSSNVPGEASQILLIKVNADGTLAESFGNGGVKVLLVPGGGSQFVSGVAVDLEDRIVLGGTVRAVDDSSDSSIIIRLDANGELDSTFGQEGIVTANLSSGLETVDEVTVDHLGRIVVAATVALGDNNNEREAVVVRYSSSGSRDSTFGEGKFSLRAQSDNHSLQSTTELAVLPDGDLWVSFTEYALNEDHSSLSYPAVMIATRIANDGELDSSFGTSGELRLADYWYSRDYTLTVDGKGRAVVAGIAIAEEFGFDHEFVARLQGPTYDLLPDAINDIDRPAVTIGSEQLFGPITVSGLSGTDQAMISISNGEYRINDGAFRRGDGYVRNGDVIEVRHTSSENGETETTTVLTLGGLRNPQHSGAHLGEHIEIDFSSTTVAAPSTPPAESGGGGGGSTTLIGLALLLAATGRRYIGKHH